MHPFHDQGIDADHDLIIQAFERLIRIVSRQDYEPRERRELIQMMLRYTSTHFRREEASMRRHRYPGFRDHVMAHAYMQNEFRRIQQNLCEDRPNLLSDARLLRALFLGHILSYDESYAEWLASWKARAIRPRRLRQQGGPLGLRRGARSVRVIVGKPLWGIRPRSRCGALGPCHP